MNDAKAEAYQLAARGVQRARDSFGERAIAAPNRAEVVEELNKIAEALERAAKARSESQ